MAGVLFVIMGVAKLGTAIKFIPRPLITGFTSGIAVIIFSSQVKDLFGLRMGAVPVEFGAKWSSFAANAGHHTPAAVGVVALALAIIALWPHVNQRIPGSLVAMLTAAVVAHSMHLPVETIGSRFGVLLSAIPHPQLPHRTAAQVAGLVGSAFTIAILAAIESLLSAVVADGMTGGRHRSNMELVAQGIATSRRCCSGEFPRLARSRGRPRTSRTVVARRSPESPIPSRCCWSRCSLGPMRRWSHWPRWRPSWLSWRTT